MAQNPKIHRGFRFHKHLLVTLEKLAKKRKTTSAKLMNEALAGFLAQQPAEFQLGTTIVEGDVDRMVLVVPRGTFSYTNAKAA